MENNDWNLSENSKNAWSHTDTNTAGNYDENDQTNNNEYNQSARFDLELKPNYILEKLGIEFKSEYEGDMVLCEGRQKIGRRKEGDGEQ